MPFVAAHGIEIYYEVHGSEPPLLAINRMPNAAVQRFDGGHLFLVQDRSAFPAINGFLRVATTGGAQ